MKMKVLLGMLMLLGLLLKIKPAARTKAKEYNLKNIIELNMLQNNLVGYQHEIDSQNPSKLGGLEQGGIKYESLFDEEEVEVIQHITNSYIIKHQKKVIFLNIKIHLQLGIII